MCKMRILKIKKSEIGGIFFKNKKHDNRKYKKRRIEDFFV